MIIESITGDVILNKFLPSNSKIAVKEATIIPDWFNLDQTYEITIYSVGIAEPNPTIIKYNKGFYSIKDFTSRTNAFSNQRLFVDLTMSGELEFKIPDGYVIDTSSGFRKILGLPNDTVPLRGPSPIYTKHMFTNLNNATLYLEGLRKDIFEMNSTKLNILHYFHLGISYKFGDSLNFFIENPIFYPIDIITDTLRLKLILPDGRDVSSSLKHLHLIINA